MEITGEKYNTLRYTTIKFGDGLIPIEVIRYTLRYTLRYTTVTPSYRFKLLKDNHEKIRDNKWIIIFQHHVMSAKQTISSITRTISHTNNYHLLHN